jgi:hypothetical protein
MCHHALHFKSKDEGAVQEFEIPEKPQPIVSEATREVKWRELGETIFGNSRVSGCSADFNHFCLGI